MEEIRIFYFTIKSELEKLRADKLNSNRLSPTEIIVRKIGFWEKRKINKAEKLRQKIETGFVSGVDKSIRILEKIFEKYEKERNE